jgi:hypothetical protein
MRRAELSNGLKAFMCFARTGENKAIVFAYDNKDAAQFVYKNATEIKAEAKTLLNIKCKRLQHLDCFAKGIEPSFFTENLEND